MLQTQKMEYFLEWGYFGLFVSSFLAATVLPLSSELVLSVVLAKQYSLVLSIFLATLGNWLGGLSSYGLGRLAKWSLLERFFGIKETQVKKMKVQISRWGSTLALLCWLPIVGDLFAVGLGFFRVDLLKVSLCMLLCKLVRYILLGTLTLWGLNFF